MVRAADRTEPEIRPGDREDGVPGADRPGDPRHHAPECRQTWAAPDGAGGMGGDVGAGGMGGDLGAGGMGGDVGAGGMGGDLGAGGMGGDVGAGGMGGDVGVAGGMGGVGGTTPPPPPPPLPRTIQTSTPTSILASCAHTTYSNRSCARFNNASSTAGTTSRS